MAVFLKGSNGNASDITDLVDLNFASQLHQDPTSVRLNQGFLDCS